VNKELPTWLAANYRRFDAVILHGLWQYASYASTRFVRQIRQQRGSNQSPKYCVMPHGMLDPWFQTAPSRRLKAWRNWGYWKLIERHTVAEADAVLFTTQRELELARQPFRPYAPRCEINIGYGVASPPTESAEHHAAFRQACPSIGDRPYLLFLSRIHPKKGVDLLIDAYSQVGAAHSGEGRELPALVIAGPLDSDYARKMQELAAARVASNPRLKILFPGMLAGDTKWGAFYGCEAFVLPSHQENFGIAVVEALACGKPVLISDQVNICDEIESAGAGWLCRVAVADLKHKLQQAIDQSPEQQTATSTAARACYEQHYRPEVAANRLLSAISENATNSDLELAASQ
jgi:glycosyltransferase involved in cell wall biosynthesis